MRTYRWYRKGAFFFLYPRTLATPNGFSVLNLRHQPESQKLGDGREFLIYFTLTESDRIFVEIYDDRDVLVAEVDSGKALASGEYTMKWQGRDLRGRFVPANAYRYVVARERRGERDRFFPPQDRERERTRWIEASWDPNSGKVSYRLDRPSRVRIRSGLENGGPLLTTILDWAPRGAGGQTEHWDGFDVSQAMNFSKHPRLNFTVRAFGLPPNTLIVDGPIDSNPFIVDLPAPQQVLRRKDDGTFRMFDYAHQSAEERGDFEVDLRVGPLVTGDASSPLIGEIPVRVATTPENTERLLNERFEAVYFIDGRKVLETEAGFLPTTWRWDTSLTTPGEHLLTVNLRGYNGNFGLASKLVSIAPNEKDESLTELDR